MTTPQQLLDIDDALVSDSHPARTDGTLDHERCARLHNYLSAYGWMADHGRGADDLDELLSRPSFFESYGDEAEEIRDRLDPALATFLDSIIMSDTALFYWVDSVVPPSEMLVDETLFPIEENDLMDKERFVLIYGTPPELGGHEVGLVYDQQRHLAAVPLTIEYVDSISPVAEHLDMWNPLETVLSNWINMIRIGKVTAASSGEEAPNLTIGPWRWQPYGAVQIDSTIAAFDRLSATIEARMPPASLLPVARDTPLLTDVDLDVASVPEDCFIRSVLTRVKTPRFTTIAPGLEVPHDATAFAARQKFTIMPRNPDDGTVIPPVLIFAAADSSRTVNFDSDRSLNPFHEAVPPGDHSTPAGLYSESVRRSETDNAEEGFRLLLPFKLRPNDPHGVGARKSDGGLVDDQSVAELFQHGFKPFGGEFRAQRLERLLDRWRELVESGVWTVGEHGVAGSIDKFRDADLGAWRDYWIAPDW